MSLRLDGVTDYGHIGAGGNQSTALGSVPTHTILIWYRKEDSTVARQAVSVGHGSQNDDWSVSPNADNLRAYTTYGPTQTDYAVATNAWVALAIVRNGRYTSWYAWTEAGVRTNVQVNVDTFDYSNNTANVLIGNDNPYGDTALGSYRYCRVWAAALTTTELDAEVAFTPSSGSPAVRTADLKASWGLPDATTGTDWSAAGNTLTLSGGATSGEEPTIPSGGTIIPHAMAGYRMRTA